jgi:thiol-disulfide isomerase/thioredoxin
VRFFMKYAAVLLVALGALPAHPQSCEASVPARKVLEQLQLPDDAHLPAAVRRERRVEALRKALAAAPKDIYLHEAYQRERIGAMEVDRGPVLKEYEDLLAKNPRDPVVLYLAADAQMGRKTKDAIANLDKALEIAPSFGLPHLRLAQIYSATAYNDATQAARHLDRFAELCPDSVRSLPSLKWSKDKELIARAATRLRKNIEARTESEAAAAYFSLWNAEEALKRSDDQAENQARMRKDVERLLGAEFAHNSAWLSAIQGTSWFDGVPEDVRRKAREEMAARYPNSSSALDQAYANATAGIKYPKPETPELAAVYWRQVWQAALPLVKQWPATQWVAANVARAVSQDASAKPEQVAEIMTLYLAAVKLDPDGMLTSPPEPIDVAGHLVAVSSRVDDVPELVMAGFAAANRENAPEAANDVNGRTPASLERMRDAWYLMGYLPLAEAYARLGRLSSAKDILMQIDEKLRKTRPPDDASSGDKFQFAELEAQFWYLHGLYAEKEGRKMDALVDYRNAIAMYPPRRPRPDRRDDVMVSAERLWKDLGGTAQGWNDWASQSSLRNFYAGSGGGAAWSKLAESSPNLILTDALGKQWKPQDLAKKTVFVTMWASWCGPCRAELPYVEKLYQRFRSRDDVAVLALNVDDDPKAMTTALSELKVSLPSIAARDFAYSLVSQMALPANWIITPGKTEMFHEDGDSPESWLESAAKAIEKAAGK